MAARVKKINIRDAGVRNFIFLVPYVTAYCAMRREAPGSQIMGRVLPKTADFLAARRAGLTSEELMALNIVGFWLRFNHFAGWAGTRKQKAAAYFARTGTALLGQHLEPDRLLWLRHVAEGQITPQNDAELAELRQALALVVRIIRSR
jgi:hypothetical protein